MGAALGRTRREMRFIARERARGKGWGVRDSVRKRGSNVHGKTGRAWEARRAGEVQTGARERQARGQTRFSPPKLLEAPGERRRARGRNEVQTARGSWARGALGARGLPARPNEVHLRWQPAKMRAEFISELQLLLKVTMADQSEITLGMGVAPTVVEHEGGRRKCRGKSRDPSRAREDLGDLERRLAKVELHLVDGEERFEEVDTRLMELDERMEELRGDMQGALNAAIDKLASEGESLRLSQMGEYAALRDENRSLKEQLEWAMGKLKEVEQQVSLVAMAVARGGVATTSGASLVIPSRVEVPKPSVYSGARNAKEIDNFLWSLEQYFRAIGITDDAKGGPCTLVFGGYCDGLVETEARRHGERALHHCLMG
ncbi:hypothetical protein GH714_040404 [Hevea brasiliensis]|uniref:Uncharacterized protein n=1 Tax=Hevea brasiliensis TaxID=3981 RepID=A0A6A6N933_HEVBR|nr:hypothetical protein GH714_040404 [Hevea brasiliensis]